MFDVILGNSDICSYNILHEVAGKHTFDKSEIANIMYCFLHQYWITNGLRIPTNNQVDSKIYYQTICHTN